MGTNFSKIRINMLQLLCNEINLLFAKWQLFCVCLNVFKIQWIILPVWTFSHNNGVIMSSMASQITSLMIVYSIVYSGTDQRKHQSSASLAFVRGIHRWLVNSPHKGPVMWKMFPFDDVVMKCVLFNENVRISIHVSLNFAPDGPINNKSALVQIMAWCWAGDKPLSEPMMA